MSYQLLHEKNFQERCKLSIEIGYLTGLVSYARECLERNDTEVALSILRNAAADAKAYAAKDQCK